MIRSSLKRSGFKPRAYKAKLDDREARLAERAAELFKSATPRQAVIATATNHAAPVVKENPARSEEYRRLVAAMPCANCGIQGYSQHAHENRQKAKGLKIDDRCAMPLCCTRPGIEGCHVAFDQYRLIDGGREAHHQQGSIWAENTRRYIEQSGLWPKNLPKWQN